ncbi:MAG TPA: hypothetical protein VH419_15590 [Nocardioidaceae bacterium]|jgi:serine/threonine-protein kinase
MMTAVGNGRSRPPASKPTPPRRTPYALRALQGSSSPATSPAARHRRQAWLSIAAAAGAVLLGLGLAYAFTHGGGPDQGAVGRTAGQTFTGPVDSGKGERTAPPTAPAAPVTLTVDPSDYVGRDAKDVEVELERLGLAVHVEHIEAGEKGTVAALAPTGALEEGQQVTLSVYKGTSGQPDHSGDFGPASDKQRDHEED